MKRIALTICMALLLFACKSKKEDAKTDSTMSDNKMDTTGKMSDNYTMPDSATMMKNWQEYMTPGDMHKMMAKWDGTWEGDVSLWMAPGDPPSKSKSTAVNKMIINGLYEESNHTGDMMGMPFTGKGTIAYDNHLKQFISTWIDNMGSGIMVLKGPWDEATKTINLTGKMEDAGTKVEIDVRETFKVIDDNNQELSMFAKWPGGKEMQTMNIKYKRK